ncbi:MAG: PQQ-like beta-propeller repeat protein [Verrucomicrobiae bacterium]|nr:PQQ-like beta-propeller repeat protein [Verrucomicrobiae bacterium]
MSMTEGSLAKFLPAGMAVAAALALLLWAFGPSVPVTARLPGQDGTEAAAKAAASKWEGKLLTGPGQPADIPGAWPRFRGPQWDNICTDPTPLARSWPENGPPVLWKIDVGEGFAAAAIWNGRVYVMDYDRASESDALRCLSLGDGREIWRYTYPSKTKRDHGMSRTIPAVTEKYVVAIGPKCQVICVDPLTGELKWQMNLPREFGTEVPPWYAGQCPYVENDKLILGTGGSALVVAVDCLSGQIVWRSPNPNRWQMTHSSIAPLTFKGRRMFAYCASGGVALVADGTGEILWETNAWKITIANIAMPLVIGEDRLFFSGGYNAGAMMVQLREQGGRVVGETLFRLEAKTFGAEQHTPILYRGHIFGVRPDGQLVCLDLNGKIVWQSGAANRFGKGPYLIAQDLIFLLDDNGTLTLAEASTTGYKPLARAKVLEGPDAWGPLALVNGRLVLRDLYKMACLDVRAR